jgi:hypothetical protein
LRRRRSSDTERRDENDVRIVRVNQNASDLARIVEADMGPRLSGVGGFVHAVAEGDLRAHVGFARTDIDNVGIGRRDINRAYRRNGLGIEHGGPSAARVFRLPHATADRAEVKRVRMARNSGNTVATAAAERPNHAPVQSRIKVLPAGGQARRRLPCGQDRKRAEKDECC